MLNFDYEILVRFEQEDKFIVNAEKYTEQQAIQLFIEKGNSVSEMRKPDVCDIYSDVIKTSDIVINLNGSNNKYLIANDDYFVSSVPVWVIKYEDLYI